MKIKSINWLLAAALCTAALAGGCARRNEAKIGTPEEPLVVVLSPAHAPASSSGALIFLKNYLETATGMAVNIEVALTPAAVIRKFDANQVDAGLVTLEEYLVAREEYGVRPALRALRGSGLGAYDGVILTKAAGGAKSVADLAGKKVGFTGPYSVSGFTLPSIYLKRAGVDVNADFSPSHEANLQKLVKGEVYAAATYARQAARQPGLKILAVTGKVPNEPLIIRRGLRPEKSAALVSAFLRLGDTRDGRRALGALADITGFGPADADVYRPLHDIIRAEGKTVYDLVPDGWYIYRLNQPYYPD